MSLYFRLIYTILFSLWQPRSTLGADHRLKFRTWPSDLDLNFHMNNGRYLTLMDLGRVQFMVQLGMLPHILKNRWMPVVGSIHVTYRRSLAPFQPFELSTRVVGWDEKWVYLEQRFLCRGELMAVAQIKGLFRTPKGNLPSAKLIEQIGNPHNIASHIPEVFQVPKKSAPL